MDCPSHTSWSAIQAPVLQLLPCQAWCEAPSLKRRVCVVKMAAGKHGVPLLQLQPLRLVHRASHTLWLPIPINCLAAAALPSLVPAPLTKLPRV